MVDIEDDLHHFHRLVKQLNAFTVDFFEVNNIAKNIAQRHRTYIDCF